MNILFISALSGDPSVGPSYSVPAQIKAQSEIDNVFWINMTDHFREEWKALGVPFLYGRIYKKIRLMKIRDQIFAPDVVFFEGCYNYPFLPLAKDLQNGGVPYILVPRSQLTSGAQKNRFIKKKIGNFLYFGRFIRKASAIQYLTLQEAEESAKWKVNRWIIPNGITKHEFKFKEVNQNAISVVYIGRIDIFQKGLDLLIDACSRIKKELHENNVTLSLYGKPTTGDLEKLNGMIRDYGLKNLVEIKDPIFDKEKHDVLKKTDIFIMTSRFEGLPMGLIEALSFGCPCIVTPGTNMTGEIEKAEAGWVCSNDAGSIAAAILFAAKEYKIDHNRKSRNAYRLSLKYTWEDISAATHERCAKLCAETQ